MPRKLELRDWIVKVVSSFMQQQTRNLLSSRIVLPS